VNTRFPPSRFNTSNERVENECSLVQNQVEHHPRKEMHSGEKKHIQISQLRETPDLRRDWSIEVVGGEVPAHNLVDKHNVMQNVIPDMIHTCRHFK
jgi:hypothetical protein